MMRSSIDNDYQQVNSKPKYKVIVLGKGTVGKTTLLIRYLQDFYKDKNIATISVDFRIKKRKTASFWYYDTAGQEIFNSIVDMYYKGADACMILYDLNNMESESKIQYYYNKIKQLANQSLIYIIGCKSDLLNTQQIKNVHINVKKIQEKYPNVKHFITSSKLNTNVYESFGEIQSDLLTLKPKKVEPVSRISALNFNQKTKKQKKCCN